MSTMLDLIGNPNYRKLTAQTLKNNERRYTQWLEKQTQRSLSRVSMTSIIEEEEEAEARMADPYLMDGKPAPPKLGIFPTELFGKPIEELDDAKSIDRTFNVIGKRFKSSSIYRFDSTNACFIFSPINPLRRFTLLLLTNQFFDFAVMLTILANCIFLALDEPRFPPPGEPDVEPLFLLVSEYVFTAIYTFEMLVKIIARGFCLHKFTYLRDPWNWLDSGVILLAYITIVLGLFNVDTGNFSGLRTFRVLRALKTISVVPGLKSIINALLRSTKMLAEVLLLTVFVLAIFALLALQLFMGALKQKCVVDYDITVNNDSVALWHLHVQNETNWHYWGGNPVVCSNISGPGPTGWSGCPSNYTCLVDIGDNPNFGYTNFDNFGWAMITGFQLITLDFWENTYNYIIRALGPWSMFFFFMTVMFGSFYLINLMLAVVAMAYTEEMENQEKEKAMELENQIKQNKMDMTPAKLKRIAQRKRKKLQKQAEIAAANAAAGITGGDQGMEDNKMPIMTPNQLMKLENASDTISRFSVTSVSTDDNNPHESGDLDDSNDTEDRNSDSGSHDGSSNDNGEEKDDDDNGSDVEVLDPDDSTDQDQGPVECCPYKGCCFCCRANFLCPRRSYRHWKKIQYYASYIVLDPLMDLVITVCILINTLFLALDHYGIGKEMQEALYVSNLFFTTIFTVECVMKLTALGFRYFKSSWNSFDFFIVIMSLVELPLEGVQGLSALRTFRLLRVLKLAQSWTTMRNLISIIGSTLGAIGNVSIVLVIVIYIFAIIGMQLFGKDYVAENFEEGMVPRWHFRDFFHSIMMVFRILCGEWIEPLYDCMRASDTGTCIAVIISTYFCGNIMILNLFLALLLNSFSSDSVKNQKVEVSRLVLAFDKLKRWGWVIINFFTCRRRHCKVGSTESLKTLKKEDIDSQTKIKPDIMMVVEDDDKISQIISLHDSGKVTTIEMTRVNGSVGGEKGSTLMVRKVSISGSNGHIGNGSSIMDDRPKSRAAFGDPAIESNTGKDSLTISHLTNGSARKNSISNGTVSHNGSVLSNGNAKNGSMVNGSTVFGSSLSTNSETGEEEVKGKKGGKKDEDEDSNDEKDVEKKAADCFPPVMRTWCQLRCPCKVCKDPENSAITPKWTAFRKGVCILVEHRFFEWIILFVIAASSFTLTFEDIYLDQKPTLKDVLYYLNLAFAILFIIEMVLKWIGLGFRQYFTSFWCWLDFVIVLIALMGLVADALGLSGLGAFRALRTLRALRPLRAISRWQGMKIVVNALAHAIPAIINVVMVILVFWLIFAIVGVQFFGGTFFKCLDGEGEKVLSSIVNNKSECLTMNMTWKNSDINFDNVFFAYIALFQVATFEGWMEVMEDAVDGRGIDLQPSFESHLESYVFFVIFIVFGAFFTLNLFIGVIIDNFNALKRKYEGDSSMDMFLTSNQKNYYQTMRKLGTKKPTKQIKQPTASNRIRMKFFKFTSNTKFEVTVVIIIFLNMVSMMVEHYNMSDEVIEILDYLNIVFTAIFSVEFILKFIALGIYYFRVPWNFFDAIVLVLSLLGIILKDVLEDSFINPTLLRVLRLFRIGRVLRLVKSAKGIRKLLFALVISLPALLNIGALLTLIIFIFSIIGMSQFGYVKHEAAIDDVVNFETWVNSMMLLFRLATSAGWNDVLGPLLAQPPNCDPDYMGIEGGNCGNYFFAVVFMLFFLIVSFLVIINMYIAVILENFSNAHAQEEVGITEDDFGMFYQVWEGFDPKASQFIEYEKLSEFCDTLENPLKLAKPNHIKIAGLDLPIYEDSKLHCLDVLFALTKRVLGDVEESEDFKDLQSQMSEKFAESFPDRENFKPTTTTMQIKKRMTAVKVIQRAYRLYRLKKEIGKASSTYRQNNMSSNENSRASSAHSRRPSLNIKEGARLDASFSSTFGPTLTLPGQLGLSRSPTPAIPEVNEEEKTSGINSVKADAYKVESPTVVEVISESRRGSHEPTKDVAL